MINESVQKLRVQEYLNRINRLQYTQKQQLKKIHIARNLQEPIHIVYVLNHVGVCGGVKVIFEHANGLKKLGAKVTLISHFPKPEWFPIEADYLCVPFEVELTRAIPKCDVIVATYWEHINACVETGIAPVVYFEQGDFHLFEEESISLDVRKLVYKQYQLPAFVVAVSKQIATIIKDKYGREAVVCQNALNHEVFFPKKSLPAKRSMIIVGSEQAEFKGIKDLKKVYQQVLSKGYDIELIWITQHKPKEPLGRVYVSPTQEEIGELYREAFVYVSGSYYESFPLPPLEAMACGTPVVTTSNIGVLEYANHEDNCLMSNPGEIEALTNNIIRLIEEKDLYEKLQQKGYQTSSIFEWTKILENLMKLYQEIASYEPKPIFLVDQIWEKVSHELLVNNQSISESLDRFLAFSMANEIYIPVEYEIIPGFTNVKWEIVARRKCPIENGYQDKFYYKVKCTGPPEGNYQEVARLFTNGDYLKALHLLKEMLLHTPIESLDYAVCVRWIVLCYIELELDTQALELLDATLEVHGLYTDLVYLYALSIDLQGDYNKAKVLYNYCLYVQEAAYYPEYFSNLNERILLHGQGETIYEY